MDHLEDQISQLEDQLRRARARDDDEARRTLSRRLQEARAAYEQSQDLSRLRGRAAALNERLGALELTGRPVGEVQTTFSGIRNQITQLEREASRISVGSRSPVAEQASALQNDLETLRESYRAGQSVGRPMMGGSHDAPSGATLRAWRLDMGMSQTRFARWLQDNAPPPPPEKPGGREIRWSQQRISRLEAGPGVLGPSDARAYTALAGTGDNSRDKELNLDPPWQKRPFSEQQRLERIGERVNLEAGVWADVQRKIAAGQPLDRHEAADVIQARNIDPGVAAHWAGIAPARLEAYLAGRGTLTEEELAGLSRIAGKENWGDPTRAPAQGRHASEEGVYPQTVKTLIASDGSIVNLVAHDATERYDINRKLGFLLYDKAGRRMESFVVGYDADGNEIKKEVNARMVQDSLKRLQAAGGQLTGRVYEYYFNS